MDNGDFVSVKMGHGAMGILDEYLGVHRENEHWAALHQKDLALRWVRCVSRVVHRHPGE